MNNNGTGGACPELAEGPHPYRHPDLELNIPADVWVIVGEERPPNGAYVTPTHAPHIYLAWIPKSVGATPCGCPPQNQEENHDPTTDIRRPRPTKLDA